MPATKVNLAEKFALFSEAWRPKVVARLDDYEIKVVKLDGEFTWHKHDAEDEMFLVTAGAMTIDFRDGSVELGPGEMIVVPRGVEHCPKASAGCQAVLIEKGGVVNTGNADASALTAGPLETI